MPQSNELTSSLSFGNCISIFYRLGSSYLSQQYEKYQIGFGQYQFLLNLYLKDGLSQEELTRQLCVDKATTTRAITKLTQNGYVTVILDEHDKRIHRIYLTEKALSIKSEMLSIAKNWEEKLLGSLSSKERSDLLFLSNKIAEENGWKFSSQK